MSEIDKLINQAFPDELRDVEPIDVDEDAILGMTLEQLGLKPSPKTDMPEPPVKPVRLRHTGRKRQETEFVEVPVVVHHRWVDWVGWAIAACLVLVCAVNWGPWLIRNLDFGIGPRSPGDAVLGGPESGGDQDGSRLANSGYNIVVSQFMASYGDDTVTISLYFEPVADSALGVDLDKLDIRLESSGPAEVTRISRSNVDRKVALTYDINGARELEMTVRQLVPIVDDRSGEEAGFSYQNIEKLNIDLNKGVAYSAIFPSKQFEFTPIGGSMSRK